MGVSYTLPRLVPIAQGPAVEAAMVQDYIGTVNFLYGHIVSEWQTIQAQHYQDIGSSCTATRWACTPTG